ncbi:MAG: nickel-dependent hydrogenase large subunit [Betaproteobacteria bacterium]|nr:nickel-dependent hydrogenase large subunit [Betaproteobacteria bacterium]
MAQVLVGKRAADAVAMVPRLFTICGRSQGVAAALACERATEIESEEIVRCARADLVDAEIAHEYLWRILLDWPRAVGDAGNTGLLAAARGQLSEALESAQWAMGYAPDGTVRRGSRWGDVRAKLRGLLAEDMMEGLPAALDDATHFNAWLATTKSSVAKIIARFRDVSAEMDRPGVPLLPPVTPEVAAGELARRLDVDGEFCAAPDWDGSPRETGARARQQSHPLVAELTRSLSSPVLPRLAARLVELAALLREERSARVGSTAIRPGDAIAWVETARGVLIHRATVEGERIARYQIVAPTEWNFHPRGALAVELEALRATDRGTLDRRVDLLVQSLDPCVTYGVEVGHA